jgi:pyruvate,water dikinase
VEQPGDVRPDLSEKVGETFLWALTVTDLPELLESQAETKALRDRRPDFTTFTDRQLIDRMDEVFATQFRKLFAEHLFATLMATLPVGIITAVCAAVGRPELAVDLVAGLGDVDSAEPSFALWELSRDVAASAALTAAFDAGVAGLDARLDAIDDPAVARFREGFARFVDEFGSRGPNEWEMRSPTWETRPELALAAIERMRAVPASAAPAGQQAARAEAREAIAAQLGEALAADPEAQGQFLAAVHAAKIWLPARERSKTNAIRLIHEGRMPMRELGRRMVERGAFEEIGDFAFLHLDELRAIDDDPDAIPALIRERRADYDALSKLEPPFVFVGQPPLLAEWEERGAHLEAEVAKGEQLSGYAGCGGVAEGTARIVLDSADPSALEPGDVLVAPITDPSWTPLFVPAAAVVVDVGALQSHAVIVSRELGIPCVVSVTGATRRIPDGARVRVDGSAGTVTVL